MTIQDFINKGVTVINDMGELRKVRNESGYISIPFSNGWVASISKEKSNFSVATCDYNGYFDWHILEPFGAAYDGTINCKTEEEVCKVLSAIESLKDINQHYVCSRII